MTYDPNSEPAGDTLLEEGATSIGQFRLERLVHSGRLHRVYRAEHQGKPAVVALLQPGLTRFSKVRQAYLDGLRSAAAVEHVARIAATEYGVFDDQAYAAMAFVEGESLEEFSARSHSLPAGKALRHARDILDLLQAIHGRGLLHGSLSPRKIISAQGGATRVLGLGLARVREYALREAEGDFDPMDTAYMAPEQRAGGLAAATPQSDLWSVGAIVFALLAGVPPRSSTPGRSPLRASVRPITDYVPHLPPAIVRLLARALDPDPVHRHADAGCMRAVIEDVMHLHGGFTVRRVSTEPPISRHDSFWGQGSDDSGFHRPSSAPGLHKPAPTSRIQVTAPTLPSLIGRDDTNDPEAWEESDEQRRALGAAPTPGERRGR